MSSENQNTYLEIIKDAEASNRGVMRGHFDVRKISTKVGMSTVSETPVFSHSGIMSKTSSLRFSIFISRKET
jgi:hypothetical protein